MSRADAPGAESRPMRGESVTKRPCGATTERGQCRAFALPSGRCWNHDSERADERHQARAKGGKVRALQSKHPRLDDAKGLVKFTALILGGVLSGRIAPDVGRTLFYGLNIQRALIESSDLEQRLAALEAAVGQQRSFKR
jgi:hypothetical protein